ncbi:MAG: hypothetical protein ACI4MP_02290 [Candidatus Ventricola sp.]
MMKKKLMILCVAGQSNAVGYDESPVAAETLARFDRTRIAQLGMYGEDNLRVVPLGACAQNVQDMRPYGHPANPGVGTKGIHLPLAHLLLDLIPQDDDLLVIACAHGGTGFTVGEFGAYDEAAMRPAPGAWRWGVQSNYYRCMRDRIAYALDLNPENRFLGVVWCQGEHDSGDAAGQKRGFEAMTEDFFRYFGARYPGRVYKGDWNRGIWYNHETVAYWYDLPGCRTIWENYRRWSPETYVPIPRDTDSNEVNGTGLTARVRAQHFGNDAFERVVAPRVAEAMGKRLK